MVKVTIQINSQSPSGTKKFTDKIAYVNPQATNEQLVEFAEMLSALSTNDYLSTTKITEEGID